MGLRHGGPLPNIQPRSSPRGPDFVSQVAVEDFGFSLVLEDLDAVERETFLAGEFFYQRAETVGHGVLVFTCM